MYNRKPQYSVQNPSQFSEYIRGGPLYGIELRVLGQAAAGESLTLGDVLPTTQFNVDGTNFIQEAASLFHRWLPQTMGVLQLENPSGGAQAFSTIIPMWFPERPQVREIGEDSARLIITPSPSLDTVFGSNDWTLEVNPLYSEFLTERYTLHVQSDTLTQPESETYTEDNHAHLLFEEATPGSNNAIDIDVDGRSIVSNNASLRGIARDTAFSHNMDTIPDLVDFSMMQSGNLRDAINSAVEVDLRGTDGEDVDVTRVRMGAPANPSTSSRRMNREFQRRLSGSNTVDLETRNTLQAMRN